MALLQRHEDDLPRFFEDVATAEILAVWLDYVRENQHNWLMLFRDSSGDDDIRELRAQVSRTRARGSSPSSSRAAPARASRPSRSSRPPSSSRAAWPRSCSGGSTTRTCRRT